KQTNMKAILLSLAMIVLLWLSVNPEARTMGNWPPKCQPGEYPDMSTHDCKRCPSLDRCRSNPTVGHECRRSHVREYCKFTLDELQPRMAGTSDASVEPTKEAAIQSTTEMPGSTDRPAGSTDRPASSTNRPAGSAGRPVGSAGRPVGSAGRPVGSAGRPVGSAGRPVGSAGRPVGCTDKPAGFSFPVYEKIKIGLGVLIMILLMLILISFLAFFYKWSKNNKQKQKFQQQLKQASNLSTKRLQRSAGNRKRTPSSNSELPSHELENLMPSDDNQTNVGYESSKIKEQPYSKEDILTTAL
ncbi:hypothetical protein BOX15_Mlig011081g1, partial [Macrostomum lignano]